MVARLLTVNAKLTEKNNLLQAQQEQLQAKYMAILNTQLLKFYQGDQLAL